MAGALALLGVFLGVLALMLAPVLFIVLIAFPAAASIVTAKRCGRIPLYWVLGIVSASVFSIAVLHAEALRPADDSVSSKIDYLKLVALSWPALVCVLGSIFATLLSLARSNFAKSISGVSWGLLALAICRQALNP